MDIQLNPRRNLTRGAALALAALLALALALAVNGVVISHGNSGSRPSTNAGPATTTAAPSYILAPDAKDRNDQLRRPLETPSGASADDGRRLPH